MWRGLAAVAGLVALFATLIVLGRFLLRDYEDGVIHSHMGTFRREEKPLAFWFWSANYGCLLVVGFISGIAIAVAFLR